MVTRKLLKNSIFLLTLFAVLICFNNNVYAADHYILTGWDMEFGTISPFSLAIRVADGENQRIWLQPNPGYYPAYVVIDGGTDNHEEVGLWDLNMDLTSGKVWYEFKNVTEDHTFFVKFLPAPPPFSIIRYEILDDDAMPGVVGNNDKRLNPGENIELKIWIQRTAWKPCVYFNHTDKVTCILMSGDPKVNIPNNTVVIDSPLGVAVFELEVDPDIAGDIHVVNFELDMRMPCNEKCREKFDISVVKPPYNPSDSYSQMAHFGQDTHNVATDHKGNMYAGYAEGLAISHDYGATWKFWQEYSLDDGKTWESRFYKLTGNKPLSGLLNIQCDENGGVYAVWVYDPDLPEPNSTILMPIIVEPPPEHGIYSNLSGNYGVTWGEVAQRVNKSDITPIEIEVKDLELDDSGGCSTWTISKPCAGNPDIKDINLFSAIAEAGSWVGNSETDEDMRVNKGQGECYNIYHPMIDGGSTITWLESNHNGEDRGGLYLNCVDFRDPDNDEDTRVDDNAPILGWSYDMTADNSYVNIVWPGVINTATYIQYERFQAEFSDGEQAIDIAKDPELIIPQQPLICTPESGRGGTIEPVYVSWRYYVQDGDNTFFTRSDDFGITWPGYGTPICNNGNSMSCDNFEKVYISNQNSMYYSIDKGEEWYHPTMNATNLFTTSCDDNGNAYLFWDMSFSSFLIFEEEKNEPPTINYIGDGTVYAGSTLQATIIAEDPNDDNIFWEYSTVGELPGVASISITVDEPGHLEALFTWTPPADPEMIGDYDVIFEVCDENDLPAETEVRISVVGYALYVNTPINGEVTKSPDYEYYPPGYVVTLAAIPQNNHHFTQWMVGYGDGGEPIFDYNRITTITMDEDRSMKCYFAQDYYLSLSVETGEGSITKNPNGDYFKPGEQVTLTAISSENYHFDHWDFGDGTTDSNSEITVTMDSDRTIYAYFLQDYILGVTKVGNGDVTVDPPRDFYKPDSTVTLTAETGAGWGFGKWSIENDGDVSENPMTITMTGDKNITAHFVELPPQPPVAPSDLVTNSVSRTEIELSWTDNSDNETGFHVERSLKPDQDFELIGSTDADVTTYPDIELSPVTTYYYRVYAYNAHGTSGYSNTAGANTLFREEIQVTTHPSEQFSPDIYQNTIVWGSEEYGNIDIFMRIYDPITNTLGQKVRVTSESRGMFPAVCERIIAWQDNRNGNGDIYMRTYNATTGILGPELNVTNNSALQYMVDVDGDKIVWTDQRHGNFDIYMRIYDFELGTLGPMTRITTDPSDQLAPSISGNVIVWRDQRNGNKDIYLYDISRGAELRVTTGPGYECPVYIQGDKILWCDTSAGGDLDVYMRTYDSASGTLGPVIPVTDDDFIHQDRVSAFGDKIVWRDYYNGTYGLYMRTYDSATRTLGPKAK